MTLFEVTERFLRGIITDTATDEDRRAVDSSLFVMAKVIEINATAHVTTPLVPIIERLSQHFDAAATATASGQEPFSRPAYKSLRKIEQRLRIGSKISTTSKKSELLEKPTFEVARDLPGEMSDEGPRHDNDHVSIRDIKIMPTLGEILAPRSEYLPGFDPSNWHVEGVEGLLDRHFRLVREDTVGQLRDAAKSELEKLQNPVLAADELNRSGHSVRTFVYNNLQFEDFGFDDFKGLEFAVSFDQPFNFQHKSEKQRLQTWEDSKRLGLDALVCLIDAAGAATFFMVDVPHVAKRGQGGKPGESRYLHNNYTRHKDPHRAHAVLRFVEHNRDTAKQVLSFFDSAVRQARMKLVEFPGVLVPAFQPTLAALQKMSVSLDLPFADIVLQTPRGDDQDATIPPPDYATSRGFRFNLKAVSDREDIRLQVGPRGALVDFDMEAFKESTSLDPGQADALVSSLSRSFALTQGPPGTGKSFTGIGLTKVLLDNKDRANLGPLLLVSYTNHALDQMLEHLVDAGVKQIIRIGSRSKSEKLSELNLMVAAGKVSTTKHERSERYQLINQIKEVGEQMLSTLRELTDLGSQASIEKHLRRTNSEQHDQIFELVDEDGFEVVDYHPETRLVRWLQGELYTPTPNAGLSRSVEELTMCDLRITSLHERYVIHQHWTSEIRHELRQDLAKALQVYLDAKDRKDLIRDEINLRALVSANVIGVTTSGLARNLSLLRKLTSKVLISEEAGEVQESHLLTAMLPSIEHVILIGDHLQLRPQVQNYALSSESTEGKQYCLDISLFERLVKPLTSIAQPLPLNTLQVQRRMHPSISDLARSYLYPTLQDASNESDYPEVSGMRRRLFWMNHEHQEDAREGGVVTVCCRA